MCSTMILLHWDQQHSPCDCTKPSLNMCNHDFITPLLMTSTIQVSPQASVNVGEHAQLHFHYTGISSPHNHTKGSLNMCSYNFVAPH
jgi:hypothetical protein